ncbi:MAG: hypothetical protein RBU27_02785 [Bacteroidota bacterium]|jgi:hypothetical protein|nr:hypothetical protein [Bacteroidota bacterium]
MSAKHPLVIPILVILVAGVLNAQDSPVRHVALGEATEVVAKINGGYGTVHLRRGDGPMLLSVRESNAKNREAPPEIRVDYRVEDGIGFLTVDMGNDGRDEMNLLSCLLNGRGERTWDVTLAGGIPIRLDMTMGAGTATVDLTDIHLRAFHLDAGAGTVLLHADRPNAEDIGHVTISAGVGALRAERLGNLRFNELAFEGGIGEYRIDCSGALPDNAKVVSDVGVGTLTIVLPRDVGAKAITNDNWLSSRKMYGFIQKNDVTYCTPDYQRTQRRVLLDVRSGLGSVVVRRMK